MGVGEVRFLGRLPQEQMTNLMATSDACYVSLADHPLSAVTMPSKTQATLAAGRAVIAAASGDLASLVRDGGLGCVANPGDADSIAQALRAAASQGRTKLAEIGAAARARYLAEFSVDHTTDRLEAILGTAARRPRGTWTRFSPARAAS